MGQRTMIPGVIHISVGGPIHKIRAGGRTYKFEMHRYCGPMLLRKDGEPSTAKRQPSQFLHAVSCWAQQGERVKDGLCVWDDKLR